MYVCNVTAAACGMSFTYRWTFLFNIALVSPNALYVECVMCALRPRPWNGYM